MSKVDSTLEHDTDVAFAWLRQMIGQVQHERPWTMVDEDPIGIITSIDRMRLRFEAAGIPVPSMADPLVDPLANMIAWRDFLGRFVVIH